MNLETEKKVSTVLRTLPSVVTGFKYGGWSKDELASFFINTETGKPITPAKALQKVNACRETGAILWREDRVRVCAMLMFGVECHRALEDSEMSEMEFEARRAMLSGRHTGLRHAADVADGRAPHPNEQRI